MNLKISRKKILDFCQIFVISKKNPSLEYGFKNP